MFTVYMPYSDHTKAFLIWRKCLLDNQKLRKNLSLPKNKKEDYQMCRNHYDTYTQTKLAATRKELGIKDKKNTRK